MNPIESDAAKADDGEQVTSQRAAQRLRNEMEYGYHESAEEDLATSKAFMKVAAKSLLLEEE